MSADRNAPDDSASTRRAPLSRYVLAVLLAIGLAAAAGFLASRFRAEDPWLVGVVFSAAMVGPLYALSWLLLVSSLVVEEDPHVEENVELRWAQRAAFGAFLDVLGTCGVALAALSISGLEVAGATVLLAVVVLGMIDVAVRYTVIKRRES
ncbi:hypothetical protein [Georgenia sunbinii]|uniref:hypothetical protein n=1 Tax=Georgenia sunbinii TaxID=3117728 RepID=UPI002F26C26C